jgi:hypothetical protein
VKPDTVGARLVQDTNAGLISVTSRGSLPAFLPQDGGAKSGVDQTALIGTAPFAFRAPSVRYERGLER